MTRPQNYMITEAGPGEISSWDRFTQHAVGSGLFFSTDWAGILADTMQRPSKIYLVHNAQKEIVAGLLCWPSARAGKHLLTLPPATPFHSILLDPQLHSDPQKTDLVMQALLGYLQKSYHFIDLMLPPEYGYIQPFTQSGFQAQTRYTYRFPITTAEERKSHFNTNLKRKIKSCEKHKLAVHDSEDIEPLLDMVIASYGAHGLKPVLPRPKLQQIFQNLLKKRRARLLYTSDAQGILAGVLFGYDRQTVYYYFSGLDRRFREQYNSDFLFHSLQAVPEWQGRQFDFMGANTPALEPFKRSFGGKRTSFYRLTWYRNPLVRLLFKARSWQHKRSRKTGRQT